MPLRSVSVLPLLVAAGHNINRLGHVNGTESGAPLNPGQNIAEAKCENVWMEVCTKVAAAALVSVAWRVSWGAGIELLF